MWKGKSSMGYITIGVMVMSAFISVENVYAQQAVTCVEWGEAQESPQLGMNARMLRDHPEPDCMQPEWASWRYDWNSQELRRDVADLKPKILRFPGGTVGNYWWWDNETRQVIGDDGVMRTLDMCAATTIGLSQSQYIGCNGVNLDFTADSYDASVKKTTITLESYRDAIEYFRTEENLVIQEMFMISLLDPFYYLGSPHLEAITNNGSYDVIRDTIFNNAIHRAMVQLDKIKEVYCDGCETVDESFDFELGNEYYLQRYGKYFPRPECLDMVDLCGDCRTDVNLYADICEVLIPIIRERFPNSRIAMSGSRDLLQLPWNQVLIDRFGSGDVRIDATAMHFYPEARNIDSLSLEVCTGQLEGFDPDRVLHYQQKSIQDLFTQKRMDLFAGTDIDVWITEFNNYDFSEDCSLLYPNQVNEDDYVFDSGNWIHTLSIMNLFNEFIGFRSQVADPWMNSSKNLELTRMCMQVMYGSNRVAVIRPDRKLSAQGMAIETLMALTNNSTSITRLILADSENLQFDAQGDWQAVSGLSEPLPLHYNLEYTNDDGQEVTVPTWDAYGFKFETDQGPKVLLVNLKGSPLNIDMTHVEGFEEGTHCINRNVNATELNQTLEQEHSSSQIHSEIADVSSSAVVVPAYSICILNGITWTSTGLENVYSISENDIQVFPNPSSGEVKVKIKESLGDYKLKILDVTGKVLKTEQGSDAVSSLDMSYLQNGMYFIQIEVAGQKKIKPLVIQN
jgi:hypothetical protein